MGEYRAWHVIMATPLQVTGMETWRGHQMHSHNYRSSRRFASQVVLVVGNMFSGESQHLWCTLWSCFFGCTCCCCGSIIMLGS